MAELNRQARALIDAMGDVDGPEPGRRERLRRSVAASLAVAAKGGALGASAVTKIGAAAVVSKTITGVTLGWCLLAGAATGALIVTPVTILENPARRTTAHGPTVASKPVLEAPRPSPDIANEILSPLAHARPAVASAVRETTTALRPEPRSAKRAAEPAHEPLTAAARNAAAPAARPKLSEEMPLIEGAQRALREGDPAGALAWLDRYDQQFGRAMLAQESGVIRVLSLCELGREREAMMQAQALLAEVPSSPLLPRLRASCAFRAAARKSNDP